MANMATRWIRYMSYMAYGVINLYGLNQSGFDVFFADYSLYNATTFDPYAIPIKGNYGIDSIRNETAKALEKYHEKSIAAAQVDIVGYSMGGLMARGFVQQSDYNKQDNFMKGSIHRLITIGTPHFGGHLSKILYKHQDHMHCETIAVYTYILLHL
jgi:triacylglycerol esterase/lipase EstA (alpha/beta hydrolase family)